MMYYKKNLLHSHLHLFLTIVVTLIVIGSLFIYSASSVYALETFGNSHYFVKRQLIGITVGFFAFTVAYIVPTNLIKKTSLLFLLLSLGLTAMTLLPYLSLQLHGSSRWLHLGGITFQPSELLKISLPLFLAYFLEKKGVVHATFFKYYLPLVSILSLISIILLKQPDFGLTVTLLLTVLILLFIAQFQPKHAVIITCGLIVGSSVLIFMRPYRLQRILTFLDPWQDPKGTGFQIIQSLIAIGSGRWLGMGITHSKQKFFYLPMQHTDFIFSIIAEETGFLGCLFLIILYILFFYFGIRIAHNMKNLFSTYAILGFIILVSLQAIINITVATNLAPTKGIGLPFISYGNTALVCNLIMIGIIANMVYNEKTIYRQKE